jgi:hypothetical protein
MIQHQCVLYSVVDQYAESFPLFNILLELEQVDQDPDFVALSRHFKATAMELISVLEQVIFLL